MSDENRNNHFDEKADGIDRMKDQAIREARFLEDITKSSGCEPDSSSSESLGDRVKCIREKEGLTLSDVASRTGYDESYLQQIENNEISPALGVLIKLGKALDMKMGYFISGGATKPYTVVREDERQSISRRASSKDRAYGYSYQSLAPGKTDRRMEPFMITLEPSEDCELSTHEGQEFIFVLEGRMEAILDQDRVVLGPGDSIYYDSSIPHLVRCIDVEQTRILAVLYAYEK